MFDIAMQRKIIVALSALWVSACVEPQIQTPDAGYFNFLDASGEPTPPNSPVIDPVPNRQPYPIVTIRGLADGRRVIVEGGPNPVASTVVPDGSFCVDIELPQPGDYTFSAYTQSMDGLISASPTEISVTFDPASSSISNAQTCDGSDPAGCAMQTEICDNGRDDDCNNLVDDDDPACANCLDDNLEPNNSPDAPRIDPARINNLRICPNDPDYYGVYLKADETLNARIYFDHSFGNIDMQLLNEKKEILERSNTSTDDEALTYTSSTAGEFILFIYSDDGANNPYSLELTLE